MSTMTYKGFEIEPAPSCLEREGRDLMKEESEATCSVIWQGELAFLFGKLTNIEEAVT